MHMPMTWAKHMPWAQAHGPSDISGSRWAEKGPGPKRDPGRVPQRGTAHEEFMGPDP